MAAAASGASGNECPWWTIDKNIPSLLASRPSRNVPPKTAIKATEIVTNRLGEFVVVHLYSIEDTHRNLQAQSISGANVCLKIRAGILRYNDFHNHSLHPRFYPSYFEEKDSDTREAQNKRLTLCKNLTEAGQALIEKIRKLFERQKLLISFPVEAERDLKKASASGFTVTVRYVDPSTHEDAEMKIQKAGVADKWKGELGDTMSGYGYCCRSVEIYYSRQTPKKPEGRKKFLGYKLHFVPSEQFKKWCDPSPLKSQPPCEQSNQLKEPVPPRKLKIGKVPKLGPIKF